MNDLVLSVNGMMCEGCENRVKKVLSSIDGVYNVTADHNTGKVVVSSKNEVDKNTIVEAIEDIGYEVINA